MAANIAAIRTNVRRDLHDEDSANYVWVDNSIDRAIGRAVTEYSRHAPRQQKTTLSTTAGSRDLSLTSLTNRLDVERVEWPTLSFPPEFVGFSEWGDTLTMDVLAAPSSIQNVFVFWNSIHTLDGSTSTIPAAHDDIIAIGAAAYAALDRDAYAINRANTGGEDVWGRYEAFGTKRRAEFLAALAEISRQHRLRVGQMFSTDAPAVFEQSRVKY